MSKGAISSKAVSTLPRGLSIDPSGTGLTFSPNQIPASTHLFFATDFMVAGSGSQLHLVFGSRSLFNKKSEFDRAIEIVYPKDFAANFLVESIWNQPGVNGIGKFTDLLELEAKKYGRLATNNDAIFEMPKDPSNYRLFPANMSISSIGSGQCMIEFFEATPGMIAALTNQGVVRPDDSVASVVSVITEPATLYQFFVKVREIFEKKVQ